MLRHEKDKSRMLIIEEEASIKVEMEADGKS